MGREAHRLVLVIPDGREAVRSRIQENKAIVVAKGWIPACAGMTTTEALAVSSPG
jgi:hypothetical protein